MLKEYKGSSLKCPPHFRILLMLPEFHAGTSNSTFCAGSPPIRGTVLLNFKKETKVNEEINGKESQSLAKLQHEPKQHENHLTRNQTS